MDLAVFRQDKETPLLRPRLPHVLGQFAGAQAGGGILTGLDEARIDDDVMAPGLVDDFKDGGFDILIPPGVPYLAGEFPLKILPYLTNLRLNRMRHAHLLLLVEREKNKLRPLI